MDSAIPRGMQGNIEIGRYTRPICSQTVDVGVGVSVEKIVERFERRSQLGIRLQR